MNVKTTEQLISVCDEAMDFYTIHLNKLRQFIEQIDKAKKLLIVAGSPNL